MIREEIHDFVHGLGRITFIVLIVGALFLLGVLSLLLLPLLIPALMLLIIIAIVMCITGTIYVIGKI